MKIAKFSHSFFGSKKLQSKTSLRFKILALLTVLLLSSLVGLIQIPQVKATYVPTNGNLLVAVIGTRDASTLTGITQTGVTWTKQTSISDWGQNEIWVGVVGSGASNSLTISFSGNTYPVAVVCEYSGLETTGFLDKTATNGGNADPSDTGTTATTTQASELWVGGISAIVTQGTPLNGFTKLGGVSTGYVSVSYLEKIISSVGTANSGTSDTSYFLGCIVTLKASGTITRVNSANAVYSGTQSSLVVAFSELPVTASYFSIATSGGYYTASLFDGTVAFGGSENIRVNGSSYSAVVMAALDHYIVGVPSTINITAGNYQQDGNIEITQNYTHVFGAGNSTFIQLLPSASTSAVAFMVNDNVLNTVIDHLWVDGLSYVLDPTEGVNGIDYLRTGIADQGTNTLIQYVTISNWTECGYDAVLAYNTTFIHNTLLGGSFDADVWIDWQTNIYNVSYNLFSYEGTAGHAAIVLMMVDGGNHTGIVEGNVIGYTSRQTISTNGQGCYGAVIRNNTLAGSASAGIAIQNWVGAEVVNNLVYNSTMGIQLSNANNTVIHNNIVLNSTIGIREQDTSHNNTINFNDVLNNTTPYEEYNTDNSDSVINNNIGIDLTSSIILNSISQNGNKISELWSNGQTVGLLVGLVLTNATPSNNTGLYIGVGALVIGSLSAVGALIYRRIKGMGNRMVEVEYKGLLKLAKFLKKRGML